MPILQLRAHDRCEIADVLGDQEIVLHETLDVLQARMLRIAKPHRDLALDIERQSFLRTAGDEMQMAAHRPEKILAAPKQLELRAVEDAAIDQLLRLAHPVDVLGDPEQRVQVAQPAFAVLDVRLDQIARLSGAPMAFLALGKLRRNEFRRARLDDFLVEAGGELF